VLRKEPGGAVAENGVNDHENDNTRLAGSHRIATAPVVFATAGVDITPQILRRLTEATPSARLAQAAGPPKAAGRMRKASPR
jgi:hypothetical protein